MYNRFVNRLALGSFLCLLALGSVQGAFAQKPPHAPPKKQKAKMKPFDQRKAQGVFKPRAVGQAGWHAMRGGPERLAATVDASLSKLTNSWCGTAGYIEVPEGHGTNSGACVFVTPTRYRVQYVNYRIMANAATSGFLIADGKRVTDRTNAGFRNTQPVSTASFVKGVDLVTDFPIRFDKYIFSGVGNKSRPLSAYLSALRRTGGYTVIAEQRVLTKSKRTYQQNRLVVTRTPRAAAKLGALNLEIVFSTNANLYIPVSAKVNAKQSKSHFFERSWGCRWTIGGLPRTEEWMFQVPAGH